MAAVAKRRGMLLEPIIANFDGLRRREFYRWPVTRICSKRDCDCESIRDRARVRRTTRTLCHARRVYPRTSEYEWREVHLEASGQGPASVRELRRKLLERSRRDRVFYNANLSLFVWLAIDLVYFTDEADLLIASPDGEVSLAQPEEIAFARMNS